VPKKHATRFRHLKMWKIKHSGLVFGSYTFHIVQVHFGVAKGDGGAHYYLALTAIFGKLTVWFSTKSKH